MLCAARSWRLTPAYDLLPVLLVSLDRRDLAMTIGTYGRTASVYNLLTQCERFGLTTEVARKEIDEMVATLRTWWDHFYACGVSAEDMSILRQRSCPNACSLKSGGELVGRYPSGPSWRKWGFELLMI